jgi:hypothetical protein
VGNPWLIHIIIFFRRGGHDESKAGGEGEGERERGQQPDQRGENDDLLDDTKTYLQPTD